MFLYFKAWVNAYTSRDASILAAASSLANLLPVSGGLISKGVWLKKKISHLLYKIFWCNI